MDERYVRLRERLAEVWDISKAASILAWDQQTKMPARGSAGRAEQLATLGRLAHDKFTDAEVGRLLDDLQGFEESHPYDSVEASLIRVTRADWNKARRVPSDLRAELTRSASLALPVWAQARQDSDFATFMPHLRHAIELRHRYIDCFDVAGEPYDILLDDFERGMTAAAVREVFDRLKTEQVPLVAEIAARGAEIRAPRGEFPVDHQQEFELSVITRFGYDPESWRIDETVHPFASGGGPDDIRLTTRHFLDSLDGMWATMHEFGHGLYEHQVSRELDRTPLCRGVSLGVHESQSRMWENLVGRALPFWKFFYPQLREAFPAQLGDFELEEWFRYVNRVQPSFIRVESDEATYNLHIILRFELEQEILAGEIALDDLPEAWNARFADYLGLDVPDDRRGILQDMHWAGGHIGYFPTYALGNVISAQIWERIRSELPDLDDQFEQGEFGALRDWLRDALHVHGRKFTPVEMLERVVGGPIDPEPYLGYLRHKLGAIYGFTPSAA